MTTGNFVSRLKYHRLLRGKSLSTLTTVNLLSGLLGLGGKSELPQVRDPLRWSTLRQVSLVQGSL